MRLSPFGLIAILDLLLVELLRSACAEAPAFDSPVKTIKFASEYELLRKFPPSILNSMAEKGKVDANGYVGTHARYGSWFESGMQRGGCWYLIAAVVTGNAENAEDAWRSVETTFAHQIEDGGFLSVQKPNDEKPRTFNDRVETAYFYLQELGHALLVIKDSPMEPRFHDRIEALKPKIRRACAFIQSGYDGILVKVGGPNGTANRLMIAAKAFGLCGVLLEDDVLKATSRRLVAEALRRRDPDGVFLERSGRDSSYNSVAMFMGEVIGLYLHDPKLDAAIARAMIWQRTRIKPTGEVEVGGNTRTGIGKEAGISGTPKGVNYHEVAMTLLYYGFIYDDPTALPLGEAVEAWPGKAGKKD